MNRRALFATVFATVGFLLLTSLAAPVYADISAERNNITVSGNCTNNKVSGNYTYYGANSTAVNITQLNTTLYSNQNVWYEVMFNVSINTSAGPDIPVQCTITGINFTLPETWALNTTSSARLVNHTGTLIMNAANATGASKVESQLGVLYFNTTGYHINGSYLMSPNNISVSNSSNITLRIQFEITSLDSHRSAASTTSDGLVRTYNVTLPAPSNMSMEMVKVRYAPSTFASANVWNSVNFNGTTLTTSGTNQYLVTGTDLIANTNYNFTGAYNKTWWYISLSVSESGHGEGEDETTTTLPVSPTDTTTFIAAAVALIAILAAALIIYFKYR